MRYVEHETELNRPNADGVTLREIYAEKVRRGDRGAQAMLDGPEYPIELAYLDRWSLELYGRSGFTPSGIAPLSYETLTHWSAWTGNVPSPMEVEGLFALDALRCAPPKRESVEQQAPDAPTTAKVAAWPEKKAVAHG